MEITEKEFAIIREISNNHLPDQRTIASRTGFSLGLTNLIIKRLIKKGYIKAKQLNQKKIQYLLTPKGFSEKARKSYAYTLKTFSMIRSIRERIRDLIIECHKRGASDYVLSGGNEELAFIFESVFNSLPELKVSCRRGEASLQKESLYLSYVLKNEEKSETVELVEYLTRTGLFY